MQKHQTFIIGDWGTSSCRLFLCSSNPVLDNFKVLDRITGVGIKQLKDPQAYFFERCGRWLSQYGPLPVYLIGVVGSDVGWQKADYISCPVKISTIFDNSLCFEAHGCPIHIVPGLSCENPLGLPDTLRGEETQIIGWVAQNPTKSQQLLCLPGTHTKWAQVDKGEIINFLSSPVGELFDILHRHSLLSPEHDPKHWHQPSFVQGLSLGLDPKHSLMHSMFSTRTRHLVGGAAPEHSPSYLSGLLIGADVKDALHYFEHFYQVTVVGADTVRPLYQQALEKMHIPAEAMAGEDAALYGLKAFVRSQWTAHASA